MSTDKQKRLDQIAEKLSSELKYDLAKQANLVPGEGDADALVMFIGEAPGADEDRLKRPFVGRSGQLLRTNIRNLGWQEADVFITNIVKHRPPNNRDPFPAEIMANKPFLDEQIETIDPLLIVTLGRYSMHKFLADVKISQVHGKVYKITHNNRKRILIPMYHPAAALRGTAMKNQFESDFARLPKILAWAQAKQVDMKLEESVEETLF